MASPSWPRWGPPPWPGLQDDVERRAGGHPHAREAGLVQRVEHRHQVVAGAGHVRGGVHLEPGASQDAHLGGGDPGPRLQLVRHPVEGREPGLHQVRLVAGPEQPQCPGVQPLVVGAPVDALARRERANERVVVDVAGRDRLEGTGEEHRPLVGQHERVLGTELEGSVVGVVPDVAAGGLVAQPLADVPLVRAGALGQVGRRHRPRTRHRPVEPEAVTQVHHQARDGRGEVAHRLVDELLQRGLVEARGVGGGHGVSFGGSRSGRWMPPFSAVPPRSPGEPVPTSALTTESTHGVEMGTRHRCGPVPSGCTVSSRGSSPRHERNRP